jgi:hypothetical protein
MGRNYDLMRDAAFRKKGEDMRDLIIAWETTKKVAPFALAAALMGGLGYAMYSLWTVLAGALGSGATGPDMPSLPGLVWAAVIGLPVGLFLIFRPGRIVLYPTRRALEVAALLVVVAGVAGVGAGLLSG